MDSKTPSKAAFPEFELQLLASATDEPNVLRPTGFDELSIVLGGFAPRNQSSRVLAVKAGEAVPETRPSLIDRVKAFVGKGSWMPDGITVPDKIDGDGDDAEDYDRIASLLANTYYDLSNAWMLSSDTARAALVVALIDGFLTNLDDVRTGGNGNIVKAGRKMSAATVAAIKDIKSKADAHHEELTGMISALIPEAKAGAIEDDPGMPLGDGETVAAAELDVEAFTATPAA